MPAIQHPFTGQWFFFERGTGTELDPYFSTRKQVFTVTNVSLSTNSTGSSFQTFSSFACTQLDVINTTSVDIEYRRNGAGTAIPIPAGTSRMVYGISNANEIGIRRIDQSNTQVTIFAETFN